MGYSVDDFVLHCPGHEPMIKCLAGDPGIWVGGDGQSQLIEKMEYLFLRRCEEFLYKYRLPQGNMPDEMYNELMSLKKNKQRVLEVVLTAIEENSGPPAQCTSRNNSLADLDLVFDELF